MKLNSDILRQFTNLVAIVAAFGTNVSANIAPIKGLNIGEISNTLFKDVLITPANYAFAIWGVIYLGLFGFAIYQVLRYCWRIQKQTYQAIAESSELELNNFVQIRIA